MQFVGLDKDGNQHCWKCGGQGFTEERVPRATDLLGIHAILTMQKLRCAHCGEYNDVGSAIEYS
jgi:hypothetical protein